jgi:hypothetical protein
MPLASDTISESCATELTDDEVNSAIKGLPHLKNVDVTNITGHTRPLQHMQIKSVVLKNYRLWDTIPKTSPPEATACDVNIRDGERFTGQGRYIPTNPATRVIQSPQKAPHREQCSWYRIQAAASASTSIIEH